MDQKPFLAPSEIEPLGNEESILFQYLPNGSLHNDIVLQLGLQQWRCDSYYFAINRSELPDREDDDKVRLLLTRLLDQWLSAVESLKHGETVYLPFDLSDQCTGLLRCRRVSEQVNIVAGWSLIEGYVVSPTKIGDLLNDVPDFQERGMQLDLSHRDVLDGIRESIRDLS